MLDQNTDRMWYVIGAVLVGAAIILIANSALPSIFASLSDSYEEVSNDSVSSVELVSGPRKNYVYDSYATKQRTTLGSIDYFLDDELYNDLIGSTITVSFDAKSTINDHHYVDTYLSLNNGTGGGTIVDFIPSETMVLTGEWRRFSHSIDVKDIGMKEGFKYSLRIRGNGYPGGYHNGNQYGFATRRVKVEIGANETEYVEHEDEQEEE